MIGFLPQANLGGLAGGAAHLFGEHLLVGALGIVAAQGFGHGLADRRLHGIRHALEEHRWLGCDPALLVQHQRNRDQPGKTHGAAIAGKALALLHQHPAVQMNAARRHLVDDLGLAGRQAQHLAVLDHDGLGHLQRFGEPRMFGHVAQFAMHRHRNLRPHPAIHLGEFVPVRMTGDMDEMILLRQHFHADGRKLVVQFEDAQLVARNDARGKDHAVAGSVSFTLGWLPWAMRASAARGSPWLPVTR